MNLCTLTGLEGDGNSESFLHPIGASAFWCQVAPFSSVAHSFVRSSRSRSVVFPGQVVFWFLCSLLFLTCSNGCLFCCKEVSGKFAFRFW